jgi:hypothetical protein
MTEVVAETSPSYPPLGEPDLVPGTRIVVQSLPPPLSGRSGKVVDYDRASQAYVIAVDGGNPRTIYRENLRIMADQSVPVAVPKRVPVTSRPAQQSRAPVSRYASGESVGVSGGQSSIRPGDQVLLCLEQHQFTLLEVTGIRRVSRGEPVSYAMAAVIDDADVPGWMRKPPPAAAGRPKPGSKLPGFHAGDPVYAMWEQDGRWYPGRVREEYLGDKLEIQWLDKDAGTSVVKKSLVCKRTSFDDLRNKQTYLGSLNLACRSGGLRKNGGGGADGGMDDMDMELAHTRFKEEEAKRKSSLAAETLFGGAAKPLVSSDWETLLRGVQLLHSLGVDSLVNSSKGEILTIPSGLKFGESGTGQWTEEATALLQSWLNEGAKKIETESPAAVATPTSTFFTAPSRAAMAASIARRPIGPLPKGPLDIFHPQTSNQ